MLSLIFICLFISTSFTTYSMQSPISPYWTEIVTSPTHKHSPRSITRPASEPNGNALVRTSSHKNLLASDQLQQPTPQRVTDHTITIDAPARTATPSPSDSPTNIARLLAGFPESPTSSIYVSPGSSESGESTTLKQSPNQKTFVTRVIECCASWCQLSSSQKQNIN